MTTHYWMTATLVEVQFDSTTHKPTGRIDITVAGQVVSIRAELIHQLPGAIKDA